MKRNLPGLSRRMFLGATAAGLPLSVVGASNATAANLGAAGELFTMADLRGSVNAAEHGLIPGTIDNQSRRLQAVLERAAEEDKPVFLPPGIYFVSNITLPDRTRLSGVPGATRLVFAGGSHFLISENAKHVELTGLVIDGANRGVESYAEANLRISNAERAVIDNCQVLGSVEKGIHIDRSRGRITRSLISGAGGDCGIYALESRGLSITDNEVSSCSNGGILVHRWQPGEDGTIVTGNRVSNIGALNGGTGQWGNGINVFRAHSVMVANNHVSDCAFSAIRSNAGSNVQITGNHCLRSGETAIYSEFEFVGAMIANNVVDGGARGISITNFMQGGHMAVCSGNLVRNIGTVAPYEDPDHPFGDGISAEADTTVTGNVIENAERFGLMLGWGPYLRDVVATSNVIRGSETGVYVSVVEGVGNTVISDNIISGAAKGSIVGYRWQEAVTGDLAKRGRSGFDHLAIERNSVS
ncbi:MAG: TIGR03808 family TAT-translocated repetitive protein [Salaquimonas sp.]|nr:TIGR03808 family TAT-translocated repetitive protein [Salaquimonas sp.]